jgi:hypothetical protein
MIKAKKREVSELVIRSFVQNSRDVGYLVTNLSERQIVDGFGLRNSTRVPVIGQTWAGT